MRTVGDVLRSRTSDDHTFLVCDDERLTYRDACRESRRLAKGLVAAGAGHGTHIGLLIPSGADFVVAALAAARIGAVAVPMSTMSTTAELHTLIDGSDTEILLAFPSYRSKDFETMLREAAGLGAPVLREVLFTGGDAWHGLLNDADTVSDDLFEAIEADVTPSDDLVIVHTSGSTSAPKGVVHTHGALLDHLRVLNEMRDYGRGETLFSNSPFFWIGGFAYTLLGTLLAGATLACSRAAEPSGVLDVIERERPTMVNGYASSVAALAADPSFPRRDLSSIRRGNLYPIMPDSALPADPGLRTNMLGTTEGGSVVLAGRDNADDLPESRRGSFGRPVPGYEARIVDRETGADRPVGEKGELWLRGPALMRGYYGVERFDTFDDDGWFHTGDMARTDEAGHWYFLGRADDLIKTAGASVSPAEVQDAIRTATGLDSYVFGLPDAERGQVVAAVLVTGDGPPPALRESLAPVLSPYKIPRVVRAVPVSRVPLRSSGKVDMNALAELFDDR
ncbi:class I adenylate-forming enzyme family protein [Actinomadura sp. 7K507]|uniref:class I adenylate-forming enzyme family protein n=1 Tax=Actinomadura sp. 7K507 TaxID=2530365 RepID=UPI00104BD4F5|nr:class I adenylate-forming enzyme family protein [Actinomadura sp. 7K507]TDC90232.1 long-chain fatty acid--CoA ligase [Actinomadura sp. 7K507]